MPETGTAVSVGRIVACGFHPDTDTDSELEFNGE